VNPPTVHLTARGVNYRISMNNISKSHTLASKKEDGPLVSPLGSILHPVVWPDGIRDLERKDVTNMHGTERMEMW